MSNKNFRHQKNKKFIPIVFNKNSKLFKQFIIFKFLLLNCNLNNKKC